ncbi:hypothetical protein [Balneicella halophila]|uniref:hypothetical protein n=1 Tax=Balneicella halophila TaxID=1537566 RepID=UPI000E303389|nr:hypothetical protein [Balneicella halophila]
MQLYQSSKINVHAHLGAGFAFDGDTHLYGDGENSFDIVNVGFTANKDVKIGNYTLPVHSTFLWNPSVEIARMQIAVDLF